MSCPSQLSPSSNSSTCVLPSTGSASEVGDYLCFNVYADPNSTYYSTNFMSGAADQVTFVYKMLSGDVLDIELTKGQVYSSYEFALNEYSSIINAHMAKNMLSNILGSPTGSFNHDGVITNSLSGSHINLIFPRFDFAYSRRVASGISAEVSIGGDTTVYSASFDLTEGKQDYNLQSIISSSAASDTAVEYYNKVGNKKILIHKVFYRTPAAMWRFFGYWGGFNAVSNLSSYGVYSNSTDFQLTPVWENKLQGQIYEETLRVRNSQYSFEIRNNKLRIFPIPRNLGSSVYPTKMWINFSIPIEAYESEDESIDIGLNGVNSINNAPFDLLPFESINSIGKNWIRKYSLALCKEMLGHVRGKFSTLPIPNNDVTLNWSELLSQAKEEKENLRKELMELLDELTYSKLSQSDAELVDATSKLQERIPNFIYVG